MKFIALTMRVDLCGQTYKEKRDAIDQQLISLISESGFLPLLLPNNIAVAKKILTQVKPAGIILSGGNNLISYGGDAPERDELEHFLIDYTIKNLTPMLTICRGTQLLVDYFQQPLIAIDGHVNCDHTIHFKNTTRTINSFHTLGFLNVPQDFKIEATSQDGVVKALRHSHFPIFGIMWHPERMETFTDYDIALFKEVFS